MPSIRLASDAEVHALNAEWRGKDKPTNVLSFPMAEAGDLERSEAGPELMLGDIVLAKGVCAAEAADKAELDEVIEEGRVKAAGRMPSEDVRIEEVPRMAVAASAPHR